jgi:4-carboxymuconolactone decarboxylase
VGIALALVAAGVQVQAAEKEERFAQLKVEQLSDQQKPFADEILKVSSIGISGPYNMMLRSPVLGERMFAMLDYLRFNTSVPKRLNELAILIRRVCGLRKSSGPRTIRSRSKRDCRNRLPMI